MGEGPRVEIKSRSTKKSLQDVTHCPPAPKIINFKKVLFLKFKPKKKTDYKKTLLLCVVLIIIPIL